jgi:hypothetical protein|eukprot:COSAG06_NODE_4070_length_4606_cov_39.200799_2_plen_233_part_00
MWSCRNGALRVAERLVDAGASPRAVSKKGVSCLHWAVWGQQPELAGWLLSPPRSLELEGRSEAGCNAAVWAAASGGLAIAQWLHEQGADFTSLNHWGHGVVNKAAWRGHLELLRWMFAALPATIEQLFLRDYAVWKTDASCPAHSLILDFVLSLSWQTNCCIIIGKRSPFDTTPVFVHQGFVPLELAAEAGHEETACYLREVMAEHPQEFRPAITDDPVVRKTPFGIHFMMK